MAVELVDLIPSLRAALNVPGAARPMFDFDTSEDPWIDALAAGLWTVKSRGRSVGLFANFRVNVDGDQIVNYVDATDDMDREDQQLVVLQTAMSAIETLLLALPSRSHAKAGPVETETERSSNVLRQLLLDKRTELEQAIKELGAGGGGHITPRVVDAFLVRSGYGGDAPYFVN